MFLPFCVQDNSRMEEWITTKFSEIVRIVNGRNLLDFGGDAPLCLGLTRLLDFLKAIT